VAASLAVVTALTLFSEAIIWVIAAVDSSTIEAWSEIWPSIDETEEFMRLMESTVRDSPASRVSASAPRDSKTAEISDSVVEVSSVDEAIRLAIPSVSAIAPLTPETSSPSFSITILKFRPSSPISSLVGSVSLRVMSASSRAMSARALFAVLTFRTIVRLMMAVPVSRTRNNRKMIRRSFATLL